MSEIKFDLTQPFTEHYPTEPDGMHFQQFGRRFRDDYTLIVPKEPEHQEEPLPSFTRPVMTMKLAELEKVYLEAGHPALSPDLSYPQKRAIMLRALTK